MPPTAYTSVSVSLDTFRGNEKSLYPLAKLGIQVEGSLLEVEAAVLDKFPDVVALGLDIGAKVFADLFQSASTNSLPSEPGTDAIRITMQESARQETEQKEDQVATDSSG